MLTDPGVGQAICTQLDDGRVRVDRADPIIHISNELLTATDRMDSFVVDGDLMTFGDINRVTYRITERGAFEVEAVKVP